MQTIIPKSAAPLSETRTSTAGASATAAPATGRVYDKDLVRTDGRTQKIDKFFNVSSVADESTASLETSRCQPPAAPPLQKPVQPSAAVPEPAYSFSMGSTLIFSLVYVVGSLFFVCFYCFYIDHVFVTKYKNFSFLNEQKNRPKPRKTR